jgi:hypothetical protein
MRPVYALLDTKSRARLPFAVQEEVPNAALHHTPLRAATELPCFPLYSTTGHMIFGFQGLSREKVNFSEKS